MKTLEQAQKIWRETSVQFLRKSPSRIAYLGNGLGNAASNVNVPGQPNKVYARDSLKSGNYYIVQNRTVQAAVNKPVILGYLKHEPHQEQVIDFHYAGYEYSDSTSAYNAPINHGPRHEFGGGDEVFIDSRLFKPGLLRPLNPASMKVYVLPFTYYYGKWDRYPGGSSPDLTQYIPTSGSRYVTIALDPATGGLVLRPGDVYTGSAMGVFQDVAGGMQSVPPPAGDEYPLGAVNLSDTITSIKWSNADNTIFDARLHITPPWKKVLDRLTLAERRIGNSNTMPTTFSANTPTDDFVANAWALRGREINPAQPTTGQALTWDVSAGWWSPSTLTGVGEVNTGVNLGAGIEPFREKSGTNLNFRTFVAGTNVTITSATSTITISSTGGSGSGETNTGSNLGTGIELFREKSGASLAFRTIVGGDNITATSSTSLVTLATTNTSRTAANLGTGIPVYREMTDTSMLFKTLAAGDNVTLASNASVITISSTDSSNAAQNLGTGIVVFKETAASTHQFKTLAATGNTTLASNASVITISSTDTSNSATNLGVGINIFKETVANEHQFKTLAATGNTTLASNASLITISSTDTSNSATNLGTGIGLFKETFGNQHQFKTFVAGTNVTIGSGASTITISSSGGGGAGAAANIGTGIGVYDQTSGTSLLLKSFLGQSGITVSSAASTINIAQIDNHFTYTASRSSWDNLAIPFWMGSSSTSIALTQINAAVMGSGSGTDQLSFNLETRDWGALATTGANIFSGSQGAPTTGIEINAASAFNRSIINPKSHLVLKTGSTPVLGTVDLFTVTVYYTSGSETSYEGNLLLETGGIMLLETGGMILAEDA